MIHSGWPISFSLTLSLPSFNLIDLECRLTWIFSLSFLLVVFLNAPLDSTIINFRLPFLQLPSWSSSQTKITSSNKFLLNYARLATHHQSSFHCLLSHSLPYPSIELFSHIPTFADDMLQQMMNHRRAKICCKRWLLLGKKFIPYIFHNFFHLIVGISGSCSPPESTQEEEWYGWNHWECGYGWWNTEQQGTQTEVVPSMISWSSLRKE